MSSSLPYDMPGVPTLQNLLALICPTLCLLFHHCHSGIFPTPERLTKTVECKSQHGLGTSSVETPERCRPALFTPPSNSHSCFLKAFPPFDGLRFPAFTLPTHVHPGRAACTQHSSGHALLHADSCAGYYKSLLLLGAQT